MIEIVCPNCQARYQLPDGAIGPNGRNVSCSNCAHKWRALAAEPAAPAVSEAAPAAAAEPPAEPPAEPEAKPVEAESDERTAREAIAAVFGTAQQAAPTEPAKAAAPVAPAEPDTLTPPPATGTNEEQMAAIRKMLSDLKEAADSAGEPAASAGEAAPAPPGAAPSARRSEQEAPNRDDLEERIDDLNMLAKMVKGEPTGTGYDAAKLRKRHEKRAKKLQRSRDRRRKSGAFLTGFTLVAAVSGVFVGLYVLSPQIIASSPEMAPALNEYVTTVDRYRVELDEKTQDWRSWLMDRIDKLTGKEDKPAQ